jgi:hypothetical protein
MYCFMRAVMIAICLSSIGCSDTAQRARDVSEAGHYASMLVYFKDARTGLCFAGRSLSQSSAVITNVPCSDAVESWIAGQPPSVARAESGKRQ